MKLNMWSVLEKANPLNWTAQTLRNAIIGVLAVAALAFLYFGLQPATPADASNYPRLVASSISLDTPVEPLSLTKDHQLIAPATIAGSFSQHTHKTLLIGHSSTVFAHLKDLQTNDTLNYDNHLYRISTIQTLAKADISMKQLLAPAEHDTIILMTCAGEWLGGQDYSHRLIITAESV